MRFIDLIETNPNDPEWPRSSSLAIEGKRQSPDSLSTIGELPHCYERKPKTAKDRDALVDHLEAINYA